MTEYALPGKVALVTGAARGIGFEAARALHARGASVAIVDLHEDAAGAPAAAIDPARARPRRGRDRSRRDHGMADIFKEQSRLHPGSRARFYYRALGS